MTNLKIAFNCDTVDSPYGTGGVDWVDLSLASDYLVFSNGSTAVADGQPIPSSTDLSQAGCVVSPTLAVIVPKYFLADISAGIIKLIHNAGNQDKQYVFGFVFDGATSSEPVLEVWDDSDMDSYLNKCLGSGVASSSWVRGVTTTSTSSGINWTGSRLAGNGSGYFLWLNDNSGPLSVATTLYCQLKIIIPAAAPYSGAETPIFVVKFTTN